MKKAALFRSGESSPKWDYTFGKVADKGRKGKDFMGQSGTKNADGTTTWNEYGLYRTPKPPKPPKPTELPWSASKKPVETSRGIELPGSVPEKLPEPKVTATKPVEPKEPKDQQPTPRDTRRQPIPSDRFTGRGTDLRSNPWSEYGLFRTPKQTDAGKTDREPVPMLKPTDKTKTDYEAAERKELGRWGPVPTNKEVENIANRKKGITRFMMRAARIKAAAEAARKAGTTSNTEGPLDPTTDWFNRYRRQQAESAETSEPIKKFKWQHKQAKTATKMKKKAMTAYLQDKAKQSNFNSL